MGIFSKFRKGLKKTRTEGITAQLDDVMGAIRRSRTICTTSWKKCSLWAMWVFPLPSE